MEQESPYLDPMIRSFLLGIGAGAMVEAGHTAVQVVQAGGFHFNLDQFAPLFVWDHVAAL